MKHIYEREATGAEKREQLAEGSLLREHTLRRRYPCADIFKRFSVMDAHTLRWADAFARDEHDG